MGLKDYPSALFTILPGNAPISPAAGGFNNDRIIFPYPDNITVAQFPFLSISRFQLVPPSLSRLSPSNPIGRMPSPF
jgi:hypothetical protein